MTQGRAHASLTIEGCFSGHLEQAIAHGRQAVARLEGTEERAALGTAAYYLGVAYWFAGNPRPALEATARIDAIGQQIGDRRLQSNAAALTAHAHDAAGEWDAALAACDRALALSPDPYERAFILGALGYAHAGKGDAEQAIRTLEEAVELATRYRSRQIQALFKTYLSAAYLLGAQAEKAREVALDALAIAGEIQAHLALAELGHARGDRAAVDKHLAEAHSVFVALGAAALARRAERFAERLGARVLERHGLPDTHGALIYFHGIGLDNVEQEWGTPADWAMVDGAVLAAHLYYHGDEQHRYYIEELGVVRPHGIERFFTWDMREPLVG